MKKIILSLLLVITSAIAAMASGHTVTVSSTNVTCNGLSDGTASASVSGGTGPFSYTWTPGGQVTAVVTGLTAGTYTITVTDNADMSTASAAVTITQPSQITATSTSTTICSGQCGMVTATITGGSPNYTYTWAPTGSTWQGVQACPVNTTTYTLTITDANGCTATGAATINVNGTAPGITGSTTICSGSSTTLTAFGGGTYLWNTGATTTSITLTPATSTTYTVTVTNGGCTANAYTTVTVNPFPIITVPAVTVCAGGSATLTASGASTYSWSPTTGLSSGTGATVTSNPTATTTYTVIGTSFGCTASTTVVVTSISASAPSVVLDTLINIHCSGSSYGTISVHPIGGTAPYVYVWNNGSTGSSLISTWGGTYTILITDMNGCTANASYTLKTFSNIYASVTSSFANCASNGTATVSAIGGHMPYTYQWSPSNQTAAKAINLSVGTYSVVITDSAGCKLTGSTYIHSQCLNVIKGRLYNDTNQNCIQDIGEQAITGRTVVASPGYNYGYTDANGDYTILTPNMNNTVIANYYNNSCANISLSCPASGSLSVNFTQPGDTSLTNNFGYYSNPNYFDLDIHPGWTPGHPGFEKKYWFLFNHNSPISRNVLIRFVYDSLLQYKSCTKGGVHFPSQHKIEWTLNNLAPGSYWNWQDPYNIFFDVPVTASITAAIHTYFEILPITGDCSPSNNILDIYERITGSRDPNSKEVIPQGQGPNGNILKTDSILHYNVHFQNNGTDTAYTVVVKDTLSPFLDPASIVPGASSHPYTFTLSEHGILCFRFDKIMLPDSTTDEPGSNGNFNYTVKVRPNAPIGTVIENTAHIYFDFNEAVVTNTTINTIVIPTSITETASSNHLIKVYPNPFSDNTTFIIQSDKINEIYSFELIDVLGKQVRSINEIITKEFQLSRNGLPNGIYFYKIYCDESIVGIGKLIIR